MTLIQLDYDNITFDRLMNRIELLKQEDMIQEIKIMASPSLDGYHIFIQTFHTVNINLVYRLRMNWYDDLKRICIDMINENETTRDILFKYGTKFLYGKYHKFKEVRMFKYFRNTVSSR